MSQINKLSNIHSQLNISTKKFRDVPKPYLEIAEGMESQFINHMLNEMRKTVHTETPDSNATQYYNSLIDQERAKIMSQVESGIGLKDIILDQIVPQHLKASNDFNAVKMYRQQADRVEGDNNE